MIGIRRNPFPSRNRWYTQSRRATFHWKVRPGRCPSTILKGNGSGRIVGKWNWSSFRRSKDLDRQYDPPLRRSKSRVDPAPHAQFHTRLPAAILRAFKPSGDQPLLVRFRRLHKRSKGRCPINLRANDELAGRPNWNLHPSGNPEEKFVTLRTSWYRGRPVLLRRRQAAFAQKPEIAATCTRKPRPVSC
jgi:hypothetical protein